MLTYAIIYDIIYEKGADIMQPNTSNQYSGKLSLRIPKSLHRELVEEAEKEGVSLNQYALYRLAHYTPTPNYETLQAIWEAEHGIGLSKPYTNVHKMMEDILSGDD